ncbi:SCO family protein [Acetobacter sp. TBRC 12305]|uniref:SCO family protein n=1 Tax=Acetobacter garciniae TaxID=2817435 RepID=A0A939HPJ4_9PROT|nr:SCO family protein [Acetobacter garciniae]MBO1324964.1 SCO family protein [Acetobacter garciniae]MBX0344655.1 SCO family protein [Acetobacter garciniae]
MKRQDRRTGTRKGATPQQDRRAFLLIAGVAVVLLAGAAGFRALVGTRHGPDIGGPFGLTNANGRLVTQADFKGRYTLIYFGYTHCVDVCPLTLATVSAALDELGPKGRSVTPIFISVDPERDTPQVVGTYVSRFSPDIVGLSGTQAQLGPVLDEFHVTVRRHAGQGASGLVDHSSLLYLMDGHNHLVGMIPVDSSAHEIATDLARMLPAS